VLINGVGDGVTVAAGHDLNDVYQFADANNVTVVGGSALSVHPTGGWLTGGGHSALTPTMGLGVDNALQIRAVLPNGMLLVNMPGPTNLPGTYVTANRCQHQDLFFALRGGGGNAFGVLMEATHRAHPKVSIQVAFVAFTAATQTAFNNFVKLLAQNANTWGSEGWGGYISFGGTSALAAGLVMFNPVSRDDALLVSS
jgi:FAD/FMN-containing dehydrogenase